MALLRQRLRVTSRLFRFRPGAAALGLFFLYTALAQGSGEKPKEYTEYEIKAAFLINFAKYVEWPAEVFPEADSPFIIGILGANPFGETLVQLARDQNLDGREIRVEQSDDAGSLAACQIVFARRSESTSALPDMGALANAPILTVGEQKGFAEQAGVVNFVTEETKIKFEINMTSAERAKLKLSSRLLKLAVKVYK